MSVQFNIGHQSKADHSYEEIRRAALDVLAKREKPIFEPDQFQHLIYNVASVLRFRDGETGSDVRESGRPQRLSDHDDALFLEMFWDLFRQGIITLGISRGQPEFPHFRVSSFGERILANQEAYFFHDVSTYAELIKTEVAEIDDVTMVYLKEAMQAFMAGCLLSSSVMLGVATEHTFVFLMEKISGNAAHASTFAAVDNERPILRKVNKFRSILDSQLSGMPQSIKEDLDTHFAGILSVIRTFRNESGHPSGKIISREQAYVNLQLFIPYCKKMYSLMAHYS